MQTIAAGGTVFPDTSRPAKKKQKLKYPTAFIRRSPRIQSPFRNLEIEPIIEEIIISGSQDDVEPLLQEENKSNEEASDVMFTSFNRLIGFYCWDFVFVLID